MTERWVYGPSTALGSVVIDVADLLEEYGPVRPGFLDKTGFTHLHATADDETALDLGERAVRGLGESWWQDQVDAIVHVSSTGALVAPGNAHLLQARLGLGREIFVLDVNDACTGFVRAVVVADALLSAGVASAVLVVAADAYTKLFDKSELKVSPLFSDGASAVIVSSSPLETGGAPVKARRWEILSSAFMSEGDKSGDLFIENDEARASGHLSMNGGGVFNFVLRNIGTTLERLYGSAGLEAGQVGEWYVHQGSRAVVNAAEKAVGAPPDSLFRSSEYGNVVQSSLPFQLADESSAHQGVIGLLGFGVGLTIGGALILQSSVG